MDIKIFLPLFLVFMAVTTLNSQESNSYQQPTPPRVTIKLPNNRAADIPKGPYKPTWESMKENYKTPDWMMDAKFGIFIHYGPYTVAAYASEWYSKHMYSNAGVQKWHTEHFGPVDKFGYKDLIPLFTMEKFDPKEWAELFKKAGARYVIPTAEHHDGFAMYDSKLTRWNAKNMGPKRDFIGELGDAVRKQGMKFGVSNHRNMLISMVLLSAPSNEEHQQILKLFLSRMMLPKVRLFWKNGWPDVRKLLIITNPMLYILIMV
jgi:hypothetical protein